MYVFACTLVPGEQTKTFIIQLWNNKTQSPEGYLDTENIQNNLSEAHRDRKKQEADETREQAKRKVTVTVLMYSGYCSYSKKRQPPGGSCLCDL